MKRFAVIFLAGVALCIHAKEIADPLRDAARNGDISAQMRLADEFFFGKNGRPRNLTLALFWFRKAADAGDSAGAYNLAVALEHGWGCPVDRLEAFRYYSRAAEAVPEARLRRALLLWQGIPDETEESGLKRPGLPSDRETAVKELKFLYDAGMTGAGFELAKRIFNDPEDVKKRAGEVRPLLEAGAAENHPESMRLLAECYRRGIGGAADARLARVWWEKAAEQNDPAAMTALAGALEFGQGGAPDTERAFTLVKAAAEQRFPAAMVRLGEYYLEGDFVAHDPAAALEYFKKALDAGYARAATRLGDCYLRGIGVKADPRSAAEYYGRAARGGDPDGQYKFGRCYLEGTGVTPDPAGAVYWFRHAVGRGQVEAMRELGICLLTGKGISKNEAEGGKLLNAAAAAGDSEARLLLNR